MANVMEYILNLGGNLDDKLRRIGINNTQQLSTWARVQQQVQSAERTMNSMGRSIGSLQEKIAALRAQREWIPAGNREAIRRSNREIRELERQLRNLENLDGGGLRRWFRELGQQIPMLNALRNPLLYIALGVRKITQYVGEGREAYRLQMEAETKLAAVMRNTMDAGREEVDAILAVTAAQQKLGVIGDEVQLAGAQELATYLTKKESLEGLIPVMNDMLAQQYGLNASQEQAQNIASMLGKVMDGQVGALSRYGYKFDDAQEKILKHGKESRRLATLIDVVRSSVGGVNEALAATPEGKLKQIANNAGDLQERVGRLAGLAQSAFSPVAEKIQALIDRAILFFETYREGIVSVMAAAAETVSAAFSVLGKTIKFTWDVLSGLLGALEWVSPILAGIAVRLIAVNFQFALFTTRFYLYVAWTKIATLVTTRFAMAIQFLKSTWGIVGLAVTALYGAYRAITAFNKAQNRFAELTGSVAAKVGTEQRELNGLFEALKKTKPESEERKRLLGEMNEKYPDFLKNLNLEKAGEEELETARKKANDELARSIVLQSLKDRSGESAKNIAEAQQKLWTRLSGAGFGDEQINAAIDRVEQIVGERIDSGKFRSGFWGGAHDELIWSVGQEAFNWGALHSDEIGHGKGWDKLIDVMLENRQAMRVLEQFAAGRYGLSTEEIAGATGINSALAAAVNGGKTKTAGGDKSGGTNEAIATGGKRNTVINITIGDLVKEMIFNGNFSENRENFKNEVVQVMMQALGMAETAAG